MAAQVTTIAYPILEVGAMKTTLCVLCLLCASAAFGQYSSAPAAATYQISDHPTQAIAQPMPMEHNLLGANTFSSGHGEMPLWEAPAMSHEAPLGDVARAFKKEHATAKKARLTLEK